MNFEYRFLKKLQQYTMPKLIDKILRIASILTDNGFILIIISILLTCTDKYKKMAYFCMASLCANAVICNVILKPIIARLRPFERYTDLSYMINNLPTDFSFPSGHTSASFAFATTVFLFDKNLGIIAYIFAICVAISRMYLLVHYPSDVLGGSILGIAVALLCSRIM